MKASVVIRTHNEEKTIGELLEVLNKQTFRDFEIISVDNSSTDKTLEIINKYKIDRFINIPENKFSHPKSLNDAIKIASGEFIVITNGHSVPFSDTWLEDGLKNFEDPKVAAVSGYYSGSRVPKVFWIRSTRFHITNTNSIIRKSLWVDYPFDENLRGGEDYDWSLEMNARGYKVVLDPKFSLAHHHKIAPERRKLWAEFRDIIEAKKRPSSLTQKFVYQFKKIMG